MSLWAIVESRTIVIDEFNKFDSRKVIFGNNLVLRNSTKQN